MYTKENAEENRKIMTMAKQLLAKKGDGILDTVATQHPDIYSEIAIEFPTVTEGRIYSRIAIAIRILKGDAIRQAGGQAGNQNARREETREGFSIRLPPATKEKIRTRAKEREFSQSDYIAWLVDQD